jgi:hypothetical protein
VLDVSGSMNTKLGTTTRWQTALGVLKQVVEALPEDLHVGLRVYGHRYASTSAQTCSDTELVVPTATLDRARILSTASRLRPRIGGAATGVALFAGFAGTQILAAVATVVAVLSGGVAAGAGAASRQ